MVADFHASPLLARNFLCVRARVCTEVTGVSPIPAMSNLRTGPKQSSPPKRAQVGLALWVSTERGCAVNRHVLGRCCYEAGAKDRPCHAHTLS